MPVTTTGHDARLPRSHCFLSLAHGSQLRTFRIRTGVVQSSLAVAALLCLWLIGSTLYLVFHDDLMASLMAREARMQYAYEDRIAALREQVEHESSLKLVGQSTMEGQVRELTRRATALEVRASLVSELSSRLAMGKAGDRWAAPATDGPAARRDAAALAGGEEGQDPVAENRNGNERAPLQRKPRPEADLGQPTGTPLAQADDRQPLRLRLAAVTEALEHADAAQYGAIASIGDHARRRVEAIHAALASAGLAPERLAGPALSSDMGGPFVPLDPSIDRSPFGRAVEALQADVVAADTLTRALPHLPFAKPMAGGIEVTSPFGARLDPFLGRAAMHTGVDLREDYGTEVKATAAGRVVSAGYAGGYGQMVELDHGHGLSTRYAHLSSIDVTAGQTVASGAVVGEVGATGRATGPHLHYETRIDGEPVDPMRFLQAGDRLALLVAAP